MYPSVPLLLVTWLADRFPDARVATDLPGDLIDQLPVITVRRFGGSDSVHSLDNANCDVDVWAASLEEADDLAAEVRVALRLEISGSLITVGPRSGVIARVETLSGPSERPTTWGGTSGSKGTGTSLMDVRRIGASYRITVHSH